MVGAGGVVQKDQHPMLKYRGTLVRPKRGYSWSSEYRGQVFLVTDVIVNEEGRWTYRLLDHVVGGFIWASPLEVSRVRTGAKKHSKSR